jgi:hypothetical protein
MDGNKEMLNYIYQNSQMGVNTIEQLVKISEDGKFKDYLDSQLKEYKEINHKVMEIINRMGFEEKGIGTLGEISTYMMINMKTLMDKSTSHIAEMMINGSTMGIIQATKALKNHHDTDKNIVALMEKLIETEENNFQQLKKFL